jgi:Domain of unknown function (DUF4124)
MRIYALLAVCFLLFSSSTAFAGFYRWVDNDGREFYTNDMNQIPAEYRGGATVVNTDAGRVSVEEAPVSPATTSTETGEHRDKHGKGEEYWRKRATNIRLKLRDLQDDYELVLKQLEKLEQGPETLTGRGKKTLAGLEKKKRKLEKKIEKMRRTLEVDLPEQARKADAYPGWLRE